MNVATGQLTAGPLECRGSLKSFIPNTTNPVRVFGDVHPFVAGDAKPLNDGGLIAVGARRLTKMTGVCGKHNGCQHELTGKSDAFVYRYSKGNTKVWGVNFAAAGGDGELTAVAATSDGGFMAAGTGRDANDQSRLWLLKMGSSGGKLWQRFLAEDVGTFTVGALHVAGETIS